MIELFQTNDGFNLGSTHLPIYKQLSSYVQRDVDKLITRYRASALFAKNEHVLSRFLATLNVSFQREMEDYVYTVNRVGMDLAGVMGMSTPLEYGRVQPKSSFYNKACSEIWVAHDERFDIALAMNNWRDLEPVRVLTHPFSDLSYGRCNGTYVNPSETGLVVVAINLGMLAFQYRMWRRNEGAIINGVRKTMQNFLSTYPLTNMVKSHIDIALFNRTFKKLMGETEVDIPPKHPVAISNITLLADEYIRQLIEMLKKTPLKFNHLLTMLPSPNYGDLANLLRLPNAAPTNQIRWSLTLARLPLIYFLVALSDYANSESRNLKFLNQIKIDLKVMQNEHLLQQRLPSSIRSEVENSIHQYLAKVE